MTLTIGFSQAGVQGVRKTRKRQMIKGVPRIAGTHDKESYWLFENLTAEATEGDVLALVSKDPDRTSAALRIWAGLMPLDAGEVTLPPRSVLIASPPARWVRELSVEQSIRMLAGTYGLTDDEIEQIVPAVARTAQVSGHLNQPIEDEHRHLRGQIAFAIGINAPVPVVLFDQTVGVGTPAFRGLGPQLIGSLKGDGKIVAFTTTRPQAILDSATKGLIVRPKRADFVDVDQAAQFLSRVRTKNRKQIRRELFDEDDDGGLEF